MSSGLGRLRPMGRKEIPMSTLTALEPTTPRRRTLRSVGAVLGGLAATFITTTVIDIALHVAGVFPPLGVRMADALFVLAFAYRIVLNIGGGYIAARLAPSRPLAHALPLGAIPMLIAPPPA